jgi:4-carboxymuconolactone decarboxylase
MTAADIDPQSGCRIRLVRREDLDTNGQKLFDHYTSSAMLRGLRGPAGIWLHSPKLAELYQPLDTYLRHGSGLSEPVREVCILAIARECDNAFEWAAHEPEALRVGVPQQVVDAIKVRESSVDIESPFGTVVELIREAFTARTVSTTTYDSAVSLFGVRLLIDLVSLAGMYANTAALLTVFDMQLDAGESHLLPPHD